MDTTGRHSGDESGGPEGGENDQEPAEKRRENITFLWGAITSLMVFECTAKVVAAECHIIFTLHLNLMQSYACFPRRWWTVRLNLSLTIYWQSWTFTGRDIKSALLCFNYYHYVCVSMFDYYCTYIYIFYYLIFISLIFLLYLAINLFLISAVKVHLRVWHALRKTIIHPRYDSTIQFMSFCVQRQWLLQYLQWLAG